MIHSIKETESTINNLLKQNTAGPDGFSGKVHQMRKEEITSLLHKLFQKTPAEEHSNSFHKDSITLTPKPNKHVTGKGNIRPMSREQRCKNPEQNISKSNPSTSQKN